uniref:phosphonoacetaldehyde reductase n=1 Tax=Polynucleobacter sp. TaxID=2029855 RepID=UPI0040479B62
MISLDHNFVGPWKFYNPVEIFVGSKCREQLLNRLEHKILIVTTKRGRAQILSDEILSKLSKKSILWIDSVVENPSLQYLQEEVNKNKDANFDSVVAFGGGSAIDTAKIINLMLSAECKSHSIYELIASPNLYKDARLKPFYAIPTTSGTGSEVTPFATIWDLNEKKKFSLSGDLIFPTAAFIDADLTLGIPKMIEISTGLDVLSHALEAIWNKNANPITFGLASQALQLCFQALPQISKGNHTNHVRKQMAEASLFAGLAISHTRTALSHSISYPITSHFGVPHGFACAFTLVAVLRLNLNAEDGRFSRLTKSLCGKEDPLSLLHLLQKVCQELEVASTVKKYIPSKESLFALKSEMYALGRFENNLMTVFGLDEILLESWRAT